MSTIGTQLNWGASYLVNDFYRRFLRPNESERRYVQVSQAATLGTVPTNWIVAATGDFNGDAKSDFLWRDTTGGTVAIWFLDGTQVTSTGSAGVVGTDWTIQGVNVD